MPKSLPSLLVLLLLLAPAVSHGAERWGQLKIGMAATDAVALLGEPVLRSRGHGFERWTYDHGAEVLIHGSVVGWTAPASAKLVARSQDVWANRRPGDTALTLQAAARAVTPLPAETRATTKRRQPVPGTESYEAYLRG